MEKITIQELAADLARRNNLTKKDSQNLVAAIFNTIQEGLELDKIVKVKGLGTFRVIDVESREFVNVNTGERSFVDGHQKITFTPDSMMKELVNKPFSGFETVVLNDGVEFDEIEEDDTTDTEEYEEEVETIDDDTLDDDTDEDVPEEKEPDVLIVDEEPDGTDAAIAPLLDFGEPIITEQPEAQQNAATDRLDEKEVMVEDTTPIEEKVSPVEPVADDREPVADDIEPVADDIEPVADDIEPVVDDSEPLEGDTDSFDDKEDIGLGKWVLWIGGACVATLMAFGIGYWLGQQGSQPESMPIATETEIAAMNHQPAPVENPKPKEESAAPTQKAGENDQSDPVEKQEPKAKPAEKEAPAKTESQPIDKYEAMDIRIRTGAYRIVGTDKVVKARPGQTIKKIASVHIGEELACYIAAYNGIKENDSLTAGQEIKIPKLEWKKKKRN